MRFARLMLERYGQFEDCALAFRTGEPDLHIIYGPNEAGKSTTLAAVSDLLFGFGARTPYNFRFDNALLRVGAELEEDEKRLVCRRRKANKATLLDEADEPIEEGALLAMLRGQTREGFRLAFSLDQARLRLGGQAMVQAKDDAGQALFAAGSGLTAVASELERLDFETDLIWGRRASAKRTFTVAEREYDEGQRQIREAALRPKAWTDARDAAHRTNGDQDALEEQRDRLSAEQRRIERIRRVGPGLRRRDELLAAIAAHGATRLLSPQREALADRAMLAAEAADRDRRAATALLGDAVARAEAVPVDPKALAVAERIDDLVELRGAVVKAAQDRARLIAERLAKATRIADLQTELGGETANIPSKLAVARLRDLARRHGVASSGVQTIGVTIADLAAREKPLRDRLADAALNEDLPALIAAVEAAHKLGSDLDERCGISARAIEQASLAATAALARLAPWLGTAEALAAVGSVAEEEIAQAQAERSSLSSSIEHETATATRLGEEAAVLALERDGLARGGIGVPADAVASARETRDLLWHAIGSHLRSGEPLTAPSSAAEAFERAVADTDSLADLRFASAEASGRFAELDSRRAGVELKAGQALGRVHDLRTKLAADDERWHKRLAAAALPVLEADRLRAWLADRQVALDADRAASVARDKAAADSSVRAAAHRRLMESMPEEAAADPVLIAPVVARAELLRREGEARDEAFRNDRAELREIERSLDEQQRHLTHSATEVTAVLVEWQAALAETVIALPISNADARLAIFEELRVELDSAGQLDARLAGIDADQSRFEEDVTAAAVEIGTATAGDALTTLTTLRARLAASRDTDRQLGDLAAERDRRQSEIDAATAVLAASTESLAPVLAESGLAPGDDLAAAVEASRRLRGLRNDLVEVEREVTSMGDSYALLDLEAEWRAADPDQVAQRASALIGELADLNAQVSATATASGQANLAFTAIEGRPGAAADAAADMEQARAEMSVQAEAYLLKRTQALMLRWAMERYRERRQDPLLLRASELFATLTIGRYRQLRIDMDGATPRLGGLRDDGRTIVDVGAMSEGTTDQLFLALRLAAVEQSITAGVRLPFLADDLFVNFDDDRAEAGFHVLAELARSTQVLFFTHHPHLAAIASKVVGAELHSECTFQ